MEIYGAKGSTGVIQLSNEASSDDSPFYRGSSEVFVVAVDRPLGLIQAVRIGHDNSGTSPSWFLDDLVIMDKQTQESWTFSNNEWLALERGDGRIERILELSAKEATFKTNVSKRWWKGLTEKHIWASVIAKPPRDPFSRVQRASCCLSILLSAMFANAMFYELNGKSEQAIQVGPLKFSWKQVIIGIQSALVVAPINILIAFLFQKGSSRTTNHLTRARSVQNVLVYVAWFLCFCTCVVSAAFSIFYSLVWGKSISEQWLSSMFISFTQDIAVNEPVKVFITAVFLAAIIKLKRSNSDGYSILEEAQTVQCSKERLWTIDISEMEKMRRRQAKKQNKSSFYFEIIVYCTFVFILMVVCYGNQNDHQYLLAKSTHDGLPGFREVSVNINDSLGSLFMTILNLLRHVLTAICENNVTIRISNIKMPGSLQERDFIEVDIPRISKYKTHSDAICTLYPSPDRKMLSVSTSFLYLWRSFAVFSERGLQIVVETNNFSLT